MNFYTHLISVVKLGPNHHPKPIPYPAWMDDRLSYIKNMTDLPYIGIIFLWAGFERQDPTSALK